MKIQKSKVSSGNRFISIFFLSLSFLVVNLIFVVNSAMAAQYHVSTSGVDNSSCSSTSPCRNIQTAVSKAFAGDTVFVHAGTYSDSVGAWNSGTNGNPIVLQANPGDTVIWNSGGNPAINIVDRSYIRITGFTFTNITARNVIKVTHGNFNRGVNPIMGIDISNNKFINNGTNGTANGGNYTTVILFIFTGLDNTYTGPPVNFIKGNTFDGNCCYETEFGASSNTYYGYNTSRHLRANYDPAWNWCSAYPVMMGGFQGTLGPYDDLAFNNVIEYNVMSDISRDASLANINCSFNAAGVRLDSGGQRNNIRNNLIYNIAPDAWSWQNRGWGIFPESRCDGNIITQNVVFNVNEACYYEGSADTWGPVGNQWISNTGYNCGFYGLSINNAKNGVYQNNILSNSSLAQIIVYDSAVTNGGLVFSNNDYYSPNGAAVAVWNRDHKALPFFPNANLTLAQWSAASKDVNSLSVNPLYVSAGSDFHLQSTSPLKGKGTNGVDIGAYPTSSTPPPPPTSIPPVQSIPGRIEAENYLVGGEGVGYHDSSTGNAGGFYRNDDVDIKNVTNEGATVGYITNGEWLKYNVNVKNSGSFQVNLHIARVATGNGSLQIEVDGTVLATASIPNSPDWNTQITVTIPSLVLTAGSHTMRFIAASDNFDLNWVEFLALSLPPTLSLSASPASINQGQSSTLTWSSTNATSCTASGGWSGSQAVSGTQSVSPTATTTYSLACTGAGGTANQSTTITVVPPTTVSLSASPASIIQGQSSTLTWASTNATSCTASGAWSGSKATSGSQSVSPTATSTYTLACTGSGGTTTQNATVTIQGIPSIQPVPGRIEAENYLAGGEGVGYHDTTSGNTGGLYRNDDVDIKNITNEGYTVGWIENGEWLKYTINVANPGAYQVNVRAARATTGNGALRIEIDGISLGTVTIAPTASWDTQNTFSLPSIPLSAGTHSLRLIADTGTFDFNWIEFIYVGPPPTVSMGNSPPEIVSGGSATLYWSSTNAISCTASGGWSGTKAVSGTQVVTPANTTIYTLSCTGPGGTTSYNIVTTVGTNIIGVHNIPGKIEAENYLTGGEGVGYHDTTAGNAGGSYRSDGVDIKNVLNEGYTVGYGDVGEWLKYNMSVASSGTYKLNVRVANGSGATQTLHFEVDGVKVATLSIPSTGSYATDATVAGPAVTLTAGTHSLKVVQDTGLVDINWIELTQ